MHKNSKQKTTECWCERIGVREVASAVLISSLVGVLLSAIGGIWSESLWWCKPGATFALLAMSSGVTAAFFEC